MHHLQGATPVGGLELDSREFSSNEKKKWQDSRVSSSNEKNIDKIHAFLPPMKKILARFTRFFLRTVAGEAIIFKNAPRTVAGEAIILSAPHAVGLSGARMQHSSFNEDWMTLECSNSCIK